MWLGRWVRTFKCICERERDYCYYCYYLLILSLLMLPLKENTRWINSVVEVWLLLEIRVYHGGLHVYNNFNFYINNPEIRRISCKILLSFNKARRSFCADRFGLEHQKSQCLFELDLTMLTSHRMKMHQVANQRIVRRSQHILD